MSTPQLVLIESNTSGTGLLFLRLARRLGLEPLLLATEPSRYAFAAAEGVELRRVDTSDRRALLALCRTLGVQGRLAGVLSSSEYYVAMAAHLALRLGLPGPHPLALRRCRDKFRQRLRLRAAGLGVPAFRQARTPAEAVAAARALGLPAVLKPVRGTGSIGVRLCRSEEAVATHATRLLAQRANERGLALARRLLVEQYVLGPEYSVEAFDGRVVGVTRKLLGPEPHFLEVGHDYPAPLDARTRARLVTHVERGLVALGLGFGAAHVELRLTPDGPMTIEVNPRLAGGLIPELVRLASGRDLLAASIARATGRSVPVAEPGARVHGAASIRFIVPERAGLVQQVTGLDIARGLPDVVEVLVDRPLGEPVTLQGDFRDRIGHVIATAADADSSAAAAARALRAVQVHVQPTCTTLVEAVD